MTREPRRIVRKQTYVTADQNRALRRLARQRGVTEAEVIREALDRYLEREVRGDDPLWASPGAGRADVNDGSQTHDDIYRRI